MRMPPQAPFVRLRPDSPLMAFDDRAADEQPDTHAAALGRVEGIEQLTHSLTVEADTDVCGRSLAHDRRSSGSVLTSSCRGRS